MTSFNKLVHVLTMFNDKYIDQTGTSWKMVSAIVAGAGLSRSCRLPACFCSHSPAGLRTPAGTAQPGVGPVPGRYHPGGPAQAGRKLNDISKTPKGLNVKFLYYGRLEITRKWGKINEFEMSIYMAVIGQFL